MTRRNEDSGLIDLDALMREAAAHDATEAKSGPDVPAPAPTPAPTAVRTEARVEAPVSTPAAKPTPAAASSERESQPTEGRPTVRPPAVVEREQRRSAPPPSYSGGDAVEIVSIAKTIEAPKAANDVAPAPAPSASSAVAAKAVPPAPATMPSKLEPDSLEAVTTEPATDPQISSSASASIPPATGRPSASPKPARRGTQIAIAAALAVALLGGTAAFMRSRNTTATNQVTTAAPTGAPSTLDKPAVAAATAAPAEAPTNEEPSADEPPAASASASATPKAAVAHVNAGSKAAPKPTQDTGPAKLSEADLAGGAPSTAGDLGDAMRGAVGARDQAPTEKPAETPSGPNASQVRPSPGAVVGALGSVLPAARACLGPDEPARSGLIVFKSDGTVARVDIKGTKPEDECVRSALSKAKVAPFVEESFSTRVTVRP